MDKTRYIYEVIGRQEKLMGNGGLMEITAHIGRQIQIIHERMKKQDANAAAAFRAAILAMVVDPECPIWTSDACVEGTGVDYFVMRDGNCGGGV